jgi:cytoskeletal protein CcmA (bactofilin family)
MALFGDKKETTGEFSTSAHKEKAFVSTKGQELHTLLGRGSDFDGKLSFEGQVRIDGKYSGQITTKDILIIGESAKVNAEINAGTVVINGTVEGIIRATQLVELHPPARVKGTIETPAMTMEKGVFFEGSTKMDGTKSASQQPPAPGSK